MHCVCCLVCGGKRRGRRATAHIAPVAWREITNTALSEFLAAPVCCVPEMEIRYHGGRSFDLCMHTC
eukprot:340599-Prymnesium_polylepis.1